MTCCGMRRGDAHPVEDHHLLVGGRVVEDDLHHEPVALGVGELVDALGLDRVLRGDDEERVRHLVGHAADRHLLLGHHFEQGRLDLGGGAVDLVGEEEVDEHRAEFDVERLAAAAVDAGADDVGRQQVRRELDAGERTADHVGERLGGERLGEAGHGLEQAVAATEQTDEQPFEEPGLADDHLAQLEEDLLERLGRARVVHRAAPAASTRPAPSARRSARVWPSVLSMWSSRPVLPPGDRCSCRSDGSSTRADADADRVDSRSSLT